MREELLAFVHVKEANFQNHAFPAFPNSAEAGLIRSERKA